jgi:hypothetical protein
VKIGDSGAAVTGYETSRATRSQGKARRRSEARSHNNGPRDQVGNFAPKESMVSSRISRFPPKSGLLQDSIETFLLATVCAKPSSRRLSLGSER